MKHTAQGPDHAGCRLHGQAKELARAPVFQTIFAVTKPPGKLVELNEIESVLQPGGPQALA